MARYAVTGGAGFIGSHLCRRLLADGHSVHVIDNLSNGKRDNLPAGLTLTVGDVTDGTLMRAVMAEVDGCFHLAAVASVQLSADNWVEAHRSNLTGAITVFDAARGRRTPVVYASSAAVYGDNSDLPLAETARPSPLSAYGADKLGCELHARVATSLFGIPTTGLRFFNVFGPGQDPASPYSGVISIFADRILGGRPLSIFGDGSQSRDFIYIDDVIAHLMVAMARPAAEPQVLNVCSGQPTTISDLAAIMGRIIGRVPDIIHLPARGGDIRHSLGDPARAQQALGLASVIGVEEGLRRTLQSLS